ncbi:hypothetical protein [Nocardiopsis sp. ATB16-24]|uniref:hypothetical protein n=1 Tax=Nocardiopsis sp. ATB16-24 TaxID=3019555 RepID=UPI002552488C|nr:hypothetical protein [Nocardiopsis sp. ATB16-24]
MAEEKAPPRKQGLHGWKAAAAVFGCGTLAAFGTFGIVVVILGSFLSTLSSGFSDSGNDEVGSVAGAAQTTSPRDEFVSDKFDLCEISLPAISGVNLLLHDKGEGPVDTSIEGGEPSQENLVRSDECSGVLHPDASTSAPWEFRFSYRAIIFSPKGDRDEISQDDLEKWREGAESYLGSSQESGDLDFLDQAYFFYSAGADGGADYVVVTRKRSAVLEFSMSSRDGNSPAHFRNELVKFENHLDLALQNMIPS